MKRFIAAILALLALALPAAAFEIEAMTDAEREAFRAEVRAYLLDNPEVLMEAIAVLEQRQAEAQALGEQEMIQLNAKAIFEDPGSFVGGNPDGDVTIVEFMDYRCTYCRRSYPELMQLLQTDGNIRFVVKEFPILGDESVLASRFAIATLQQAGPEAYEAIHDKLMNFRGTYNDASLLRMAASVGVDGETVLEHINDDSVTAVIAANHALAQEMQITGTPTFVMGDQMVRGYVPLRDMQSVVASLRGE